MAKYKPWLKMWVEWIDDPKMRAGTGGLTLAEQAVWWRLCTVAQKCAAEGPIIKDSGEPYTIDEIVDMLRLKESEQPIFDSMLEKMEKELSLHREGEILVVTNFRKRQATAPSNMPEAVKERVRRHRERKEKERTKEKEGGTLQSQSTEAEAEKNSLRNEGVTTKKSLQRKNSRKTEIPYEQIIDLFHEKCPSFPRVIKLTNSRKRLIKSVILGDQKTLQNVTSSLQNSLHYFEYLFVKAESSDFLSGRKEPSVDHSNWRCNFDWLLKEKNRIKVLEGNYDNDKSRREVTHGERQTEPAGVVPGWEGFTTITDD